MIWSDERLQILTKPTREKQHATHGSQLRDVARVWLSPILAVFWGSRGTRAPSQQGCCHAWWWGAATDTRLWGQLRRCFTWVLPSLPPPPFKSLWVHPDGNSGLGILLQHEGSISLYTILPPGPQILQCAMFPIAPSCHVNHGLCQLVIILCNGLQLWYVNPHFSILS